MYKKILLVQIFILLLLSYKNIICNCNNYIPKIFKNIFNDIYATENVNYEEHVIDTSEQADVDITFKGTIVPTILSVEIPIKYDFSIDPSQSSYLQILDGSELLLTKIINNPNSTVINYTNLPIKVSVTSAYKKISKPVWNVRDPYENFELINRIDNVTIGKGILVLGYLGEQFKNKKDFESRALCFKDSRFLKEPITLMELEGNEKRDLWVYGKIAGDPYWGGLKFTLDMTLRVEFAE